MQGEREAEGFRAGFVRAAARGQLPRHAGGDAGVGNQEGNSRGKLMCLFGANCSFGLYDE